MKKLLYLGIILMLASCGPNREDIKEEERIRMEVKEELEKEKRFDEEERIRTEVIEELEEEKRTSSVSTIKIGNLEVMTEDLGERWNWPEAKKACKNLGDGWRLPTKDELNLLYENKEKIGGFRNRGNYWSSTENLDYGAWVQDFFIGGQSSNFEHYTNYVRAVRAF